LFEIFSIVELLMVACCSYLNHFPPRLPGLDFVEIILLWISLLNS